MDGQVIVLCENWCSVVSFSEHTNTNILMSPRILIPQRPPCRGCAAPKQSRATRLLITRITFVLCSPYRLSAALLHSIFVSASGCSKMCSLSFLVDTLNLGLSMNEAISNRNSPCTQILRSVSSE